MYIGSKITIHTLSRGCLHFVFWLSTQCIDKLPITQVLRNQVISTHNVEKLKKKQPYLSLEPISIPNSGCIFTLELCWVFPLNLFIIFQNSYTSIFSNFDLTKTIPESKDQIQKRISAQVATRVTSLPRVVKQVSIGIMLFLCHDFFRELTSTKGMLVFFSKVAILNKANFMLKKALLK